MFLDQKHLFLYTPKNPENLTVCVKPYDQPDRKIPVFFDNFSYAILEVVALVVAVDLVMVSMFM